MPPGFSSLPTVHDVSDVGLQTWPARRPARLHLLQVAEHCLKSAKDLSGLLLLYSARGSAGGLATLTSAALEGGKNNVAFGAVTVKIQG